MKKIPYGKSEFRDIKLNNYYYIDKTKYIPILESLPDFLFFIRPRRFGKTLFLSMLHYYYDEKYKDEFDEIFKDTWILENRTKEASGYQILRFNFSDVDTSNYVDSFNLSIRLDIQTFIDSYNLNLDIGEYTGVELLKVLFKAAQKNKLKIYCLIDEYDNFANELLSKRKDEYKRLVSEQESMFKQFFKVLKSATDMEGGPLKKMFITGVTPMTMFDVTSGFNIGRFISNNPKLNSMLGITKDELKELFAYYNLEPDFETLDRWYNNYRFSEDTEDKIYNSDMIMHYVAELLQTGSPPKEMADLNIRTDYGKLKWLVYTDRKLNGNFGLLEKIVTGVSIKTSKIKEAFSAFELIDEENFISLLYYLGLITIKDFGLKIELGLVNETIRLVVSEYIAKLLKTDNLFKINMMNFEDKLEDFALKGKLDVFRYLAEVLKESTGIRDYIQSETAIKMLYLVYINLSGYFGVRSEEELNKGYADILIYPRNEYVKYFALIEIKYINRQEPKPSSNSEKLQFLINKAKKQLNTYEKDDLIKQWIDAGKILKKIVMVFYGWELVFCDEV